MNILEQIFEKYPDVEFEVPIGFDNACIGVDSKNMRLIYSNTKAMEILIPQMAVLDEDDDVVEIAREHFEFNVISAWIGEKTPIWCDDEF